ncbi:PREDICTED: uncharacterized protein LOC109482839 [Branchiostoma belcheri]|uniref:Uncharacterized protein LOC109482839 n=1 Tax=Branchiostoma belcheri TaxID=7741 RepID=A0A6P4ZJ49_BRABE|nr:PREDICTED: uncharacterized protein LOC109482839 [Branchiostoma belcheri]
MALNKYIGIIFFGASLLTYVYASGCPYAYVYHQPSRLCYKAFDDTATYNGSVSRCSLDGGTLAMPRDTATNEFLVGLKNAVDNNARFRFGLTDHHQEGVWMWNDNVPLGDFRPWGPGEPNSDGNEDCAEYWPGNHMHPNTWNDGPCTQADRKFICQVSPFGHPFDRFLRFSGSALTGFNDMTLGFLGPGESEESDNLTIHTIAWAESESLKSGESVVPGYDTSTRPIQEEETLHIVTSVYIRQVGRLNEEHANMSVTVEYTLSWYDPRLQGIATTWVPVPRSMIWLPPLMFGTSVRRAAPVHDDTPAWVNYDGLTVCKITRKLHVSCPVVLKKYPFDNQTCSIKLHAYNGLRLHLMASDDVRYAAVKTDATGVVSQFELTGADVQASLNPHLNSTGANGYTTLEVRLRMTRRLSSYAFRLFLPSAAVVVAAYLQLWLPLQTSVIAGRITLGITGFLTVIVKGSATGAVSWVNETRAIDIWFSGCQIVVILMFLETIIVYFVRCRLEEKHQKKKAEQEKNLEASDKPERSRERAPTGTDQGLQRTPSRIPRATLTNPQTIMWHKLPDGRWIVIPRPPGGELANAMLMTSIKARWREGPDGQYRMVSTDEPVIGQPINIPRPKLRVRPTVAWERKMDGGWRVVHYPVYPFDQFLLFNNWAILGNDDDILGSVTEEQCLLACLQGTARVLIVIDECAGSTHGCSHGCVDELDGFHCACPTGLVMGQDTRNCIDVDECSQNRGGCGVTEDCVNVFGSFYCACPGGSPYLVDSSTCSACQHRDTDNLDAVYLWDLPPITSPYVVKVKANNPVYMALSSENTDTDSMVQITIGPVSSIGQGTDLTTAATPMNGDWSEWGSWTPCDAACGFGMKARTRTCTNPLPVHVLGGTCIGPAAGSLMCYVPGVCSGGMDVASTVHILNIGSLSEKHANISIRVQYVLSWIDSRLFGLAPSWVPVPPTLLWSPPLAFGQSVRAAAAEEEGDNSMWLDPRGLIVYKITRRLRVSCVAELDRYPLDTQVCKVALLGYNGIRLRLQPSVKVARAPMKADATGVTPQFTFIEVEESATFQSFIGNNETGAGCEFFHQVCDYLLEPCMTSLSDTCEAENCDNCRLVLGTCQYNMASCHNYINDTSAFTSLELRMRLRRVTWRYILTAYLPSVVIVVTSYLQIWLSPEQSTISGRVALGTMAVLSMVAQTGKTARMPWVERPRAIDIWMLGCLSFVTVALLETAVVNYISTYLQDKEQMKIRQEQRGKELNPPIRIPRPGLRDPTTPASGQHELRRSSISTGDTHVSIPRARLQVPPGVCWHQLPDKEWVIVLKKKAKTNSENAGDKGEGRRKSDGNSVVSYIPDSCISSSDYEDFPDFDPRAFKPSAAERADSLAKRLRIRDEDFYL